MNRTETQHEEERDWMEKLRAQILGGVDASNEDVERVRKLAAAGHDEAKFALGSWYVFGSYGVEKNIQLGVNLVDEAARMGNHEALLWMGLHFEDGENAEVDCGKAVNYYICAAVLGNKDAKHSLFRFIDEGVWLTEDEGLGNLLRGGVDG